MIFGVGATQTWCSSGGRWSGGIARSITTSLHLLMRLHSDFVSFAALHLPVALLGLTTIAAAQVHVDAHVPGAGGSGSSWSTAYKTLGDALASEPAGSTFWVADGNYRPQQLGMNPPDTTLRSYTFELETGDELYGGFAGTETSLSERAELFDTTVLSGDLAGSLTYSVVTIAQAADGVVLDGFRIVDGNADGGGLNHAATRGGGVFAFEVSGFTLSNCMIEGCRARNYGAGLYADASRVYIKHTVFEGNVLQPDGAGDLALGAGAALVGLDGAVRSEIHSTVFRDNYMMVTLGGVGLRYFQGGGLYYGDELWYDGSVVKFALQELRLVNCLFHDNFAAHGGAMAVRAQQPSAASKIYNSTFTQNNVAVWLNPPQTFVGEGEALYYEFGGTKHMLRNSIVWDNHAYLTSDAIVVKNGTPVRARHSCVEPINTTATAYIDNSTLIKVDPLFQSSSLNDFKLRVSSPCKDSGDNGALRKDWTDLDADGDTAERMPWSLEKGAARISGVWGSTQPGSVDPPTIDMGAHEFQYPTLP